MTKVNIDVLSLLVSAAGEPQNDFQMFRRLIKPRYRKAAIDAINDYLNEQYEVHMAKEIEVQKERNERLINLELIYNQKSEFKELDIIEIFLSNKDFKFDIEAKNLYKQEIKDWLRDLVSQKVIGYLEAKNVKNGSATRMVLLKIGGKLNPYWKDTNETIYFTKVQRGPVPS